MEIKRNLVREIEGIPSEACDVCLERACNANKFPSAPSLRYLNAEFIRRKWE